MNEFWLDHWSQTTADDILERHAPDCLDRPELRGAIARLARQGIEGHMRLFQMQHRQAPTRTERTKEPERTH